MGRIFTSVSVRNVAAPGLARSFESLVDSGASHITLPAAWKDRFGQFQVEQSVNLETASQEITRGLVCGPARIRIYGFRVIHGEVLFIDMKPADGRYEPLIGYIPLEASGAALDMAAHRLVPVGHLDLKAAKFRAGAHCQSLAVARGHGAGLGRAVIDPLSDVEGQ